jgi:hypothetical protein
MENWRDGIPYEIAFWQGVFSTKKSRKRLFNWSKYNKEIELSNFDATQFLAQRETPIVVDAGCGMSFANGNKLNGKQLDIRYIDPLAPFYNKIIEDKKLDLPNITFGFIEYLSSFMPNKASLIIIQNALDHSNNPLKGILECIESLEIGGVLYLRHKPNEAEAENYRGFHQYNLSLEDDELIIWNKTEKTNINAFVMDFAETETSTYDGEIITVITKKQELSKELFDYSKDISFLCNQYINTVVNFSRPSHSVSYHWNFCRFRIVQLLIQRCSWSTRMKVKRIINHFFAIVKRKADRK